MATTEYCDTKPARNNHLHIAIVSRGCPSSDYPLNGIFEFDQAKALAKLGHRVSFVAIDLRSIRRKRKLGLSSFTKDGVTIFEYSFPLGAVPTFIEKAIGWCCARKAIACAIKEQGDLDIVHAHFAIQGYYGKMIKERLSVPLVYTEHCSAVVEKKEHYCKVAQEACEAADAPIAVSSYLKKAISPWCKIEPRIVWNIADLCEFSCEDSLQKEPPFHFISVGSLTKNKHHASTIRAIKSLLDEGYVCRLTIIGDGPERNELSNLIEKLGLESAIKLTGLLARDKIAEHFRDAHCFVLPSRSETFGVAYIEAMAAGLPVVATKCGGPEDFINSSCGIVAQDHTLEALVCAMREAMTKICSFDSAAISSYARTNFSPEAIGSKIVGIYREILAK